ncbi:GNAT family N-acetyltransferase [Oceaniserpentilla sp. 4NH20-0058]|uniref:GNAT family N-acetyltransferase n=1 Tax=Oceaniserpentilla sp. 4NH20-0058 TaxID=3127660 RepID=UPI0031078D90
MQWLNSIEQAPDSIWQNSYPFTQKAFIQALEQYGSINAQSGWQGHFLYDEKQNLLLPSFLKQHSYGEYVFDWSWAEAYSRHGLNYYPKLIIAAPFTPATGPRIISSDLNRVNGELLSTQLQQHCHEQNLSGVHILFCNQQERELLTHENWHERKSVQFHWFNYGYQSFDDYLSRFKSRKRKAVNKERKSIRQQHIEIRWLNTENLTLNDWQFFYQCYQSTYQMRGMQGYLTLNSFKQMGRTMGAQMKFVFAYQNNEPIACALYFCDDKNLYGRYWGAIKDFENLHFELCYYQGIEYCIANGLSHFDPGTQGEHKIARGFEPIYTRSLHYLVHKGFHEAVGDFVKEESKSLALYKQSCYEALPFNEKNMPNKKD